ncbi:MAG: hypothetical protein RR446_12045, partial [Lachnospiraceae bacterium]
GLAHSEYMTAVEQKGEEYRFVMYEHANIAVAAIPEMLKQFHGDLIFKVDANPYFCYYKPGTNKKAKEESALEVVKKVLNAVKTLIL